MVAGAYVLGDVGRRVTSVKRAWHTAVLKAHGHRPVWQRGSLSAASRAALQTIDLHFHDLRQEMLGHSSIEQTSTYLNVTAVGQASMRKSDDARIRCNAVAINTTIDQPLDGNDEEQNDDKGLLH
jgi:integrase